MTAPLPTPNIGDYSSHGLRSYREAASYLAENERLKGGRQRSTMETACAGQRKVSPCGSPPRYRPGSSSSRCRARSPPQATSPSSEPSSSLKAKAPRSVSPGGTAASSAGAALRSSARSSSPQDQGEAQPPRRVWWAEALVASVRTRPRTPRKDVPSLFYSRADERRFRREAAEEAPPDDEWCEQLEDDSLASLSDDEEDELPPSPPPAAHQPKEKTGGHKPLWSPARERKDYAISKAVVVFGDSTRTYGASLGGCAVEAALGAEAAFSFDDAAFWNGQLTWS